MFAATKLSHDETIEVQRVKEEGMYTCGVSLFPGEHSYRHSVVVREALKCSALVETAYYSSPRVCFEACCVYVGQLMGYLMTRDSKALSHSSTTLCSVQDCWQKPSHSWTQEFQCKETQTSVVNSSVACTKI